MNQAEFDELKTTFPWTEQVAQVNGMGGLVRVIDRYGREVPIFTMTKFLMFITRRMTPTQKEEGTK